MKKSPEFEFFYQLISLLIAILLVHAIYVTVIRPNAEQVLAQQQAEQQAGLEPSHPRSLYVVVKDYEQETCFILMVWALFIMSFKARTSLTEKRLLSTTVLNVNADTSILPDDARNLCRPLEQLPNEQRKMLLPRILHTALNRFSATSSIAAVATAIKDICDSEADRLDSELAMIRYISWAIPSIGFIGTVRGIGDALGQANKAVEGDIIGVTNSLGVAFNSTFVALVISIFIMFFTHQLQLLQERLVQNTQDYCDDHLLNHLKTLE